MDCCKFAPSAKEDEMTLPSATPAAATAAAAASLIPVPIFEPALFPAASAPGSISPLIASENPRADGNIWTYACAISVAINYHLFSFL